MLDEYIKWWKGIGWKKERVNDENILNVQQNKIYYTKRRKTLESSVKVTCYMELKKQNFT